MFKITISDLLFTLFETSTGAMLGLSSARWVRKGLPFLKRVKLLRKEKVLAGR